MNKKLIELSTETLLEKFGAGSHKPGSGSAVALQGMLSAQLILTVIELTCDEKRREDYYSVVYQLENIASNIKENIYPRLKELFQIDSEMFHEVIELRIARNKAPFQQKKLIKQNLETALIKATDTPIEIAEWCLLLLEFAYLIFKNGFKSARGDSSAALNSAIASVAGCLSIIDLNVLSIYDKKWLEANKNRIEEIKLKHSKFSPLIKECLLVLETEVKNKEAYTNDIEELKTFYLNKKILLDSDIEKAARKTQIILWNYQSKIWKHPLENPREILKPDVAFEKLLNYRVITRESLGTYDDLGEFFEIAGIIDNNKKAVGISKKFPITTQNFTLAHELGHALLHKQAILHRDRAIDGYYDTPRDLIEKQADKYASYFLMPSKQVKKLFKETFSMDRFFLNEDSVFALSGRSLSSFRSNYRSQREVSKAIASAKSFFGKPFDSMAESFNVSVTAMAIRLEELDLVEFEFELSEPTFAQ